MAMVVIHSVVLRLSKKIGIGGHSGDNWGTIGGQFEPRYCQLTKHTFICPDSSRREVHVWFDGTHECASPAKSDSVHPSTLGFLPCTESLP